MTSLFNLLSVLTRQQPLPLMVTAIAAEETELVKLPLEVFCQLAERFPASGVQMVQVCDPGALQLRPGLTLA